MYSLIIETIPENEIIMITADAEVLLHPVRIKILTALADGEATPQQIATVAPDVPKASLYRHLNILRAVGAIREVREYRVRGTFEKVYALETETGPLAGWAVADTGAPPTLTDWLDRMARPLANGAAGTGHDPPAREVWKRGASLTDDEVQELQEMIDEWLAGRNSNGASRGTAWEIRMSAQTKYGGRE